MTDIDRLAKLIESDEESVRNTGAGRGRLLDDLRQVPLSQMREVFGKVYADDRASGKSTVIDLVDGKLTIIASDKQPAATTTADKTKTSDDGNALEQVKQTWDSLDWYEKLIAAGIAIETVKVGNSALQAALDKAKKSSNEPTIGEQLQAPPDVPQKQWDAKTSVIRKLTTDLEHYSGCALREPMADIRAMEDRAQILWLVRDLNTQDRRANSSLPLIEYEIAGGSDQVTTKVAVGRYDNVKFKDTLNLSDFEHSVECSDH